MEIYPSITQIHSTIFGDRAEIYLIRGEMNALIDTGTSEAPEKDIAPVLRGLDLTFGDIDLILNTHGHPDHIGGNSVIMGQSNAKVCIHADDAVFLQDHKKSFNLYFAPVSEAILGKEHLEEEEVRFLEMSGPDLAVEKKLQDNDVINLGKGCDLRVIHLPGHTSGSVGFFWEEEGILLSGDSLPGLHTEDGGLPIIYDFSSYKRSLAHLKEIPIETILTAHPFRGLSLPPSSIKRNEEVSRYIQECYKVAEWIEEAADIITLDDASERTFIELADEIISAIPKEAGFIPLSKTPMPRFNATTILSCLGML